MTEPPAARLRRARARRALLAFGVLLVAGVLTSVAAAALPSTTDPRATLTPGDVGVSEAAAIGNGMELLANRPKPAGFFNPANPGDFGFVNSDLALQGNHAFVGNFNGFQIYDISNPANPTIVTAVVCPGGQGEVSVYGNLLFMSAEETRARTDCGSPGVPSGDPLRFRGVRIFDISNLAAPVQVATVQTCRGSHTHTLLKSPHDDDNIYVYVNGTGGVRSTTEMASCRALPPGVPLTTPQFDVAGDPAPLSQWRIEVIKVPLAAPQTAAVVNNVRLFKNEATGQINSLQNAPPDHNPTLPGAQHPSNTAWSPSPTTDSCHDITTFPELDIAAGACEGNGLLIDISDPANPVRIHEVTDDRFAYWHGATFSNDGKKVVFTDEWGGGTAARCRATDDLSWGADAIYEIVDGKLEFRSYYKLPVAQTTQENCVSHLPSLVPVLDRDIMVQAWYQGGASVIDFTDAANPREIAYYDRGPMDKDGLVLSGLWSTYYYNGAVYGSEIARGLDVWRLTPTAELREHELAAASRNVLDRLTPQHQPQFPSYLVVAGLLDDLIEAGAIEGQTLRQAEKFIEASHDYYSRAKPVPAAANLRALSKRLKGEEFDDLREAVLALAAVLDS